MLFFPYKAFGKLCIFLGSFSLLTACVPIALLIGTGTGTDIATQERGVKGTFKDVEIRSQIDAAFLQKSHILFSNISIAVQDGRVLLTGSVLTSKTRAEAITLVKHIEGVKTVFDEIKIGAPKSFGNETNDTWISTKARSELIAMEGIHSNNYSVTTFNGVVYLMGIAQNNQELDHAIQVVKTIKGVQKVVSHMTIK